MDFTYTYGTHLDKEIFHLKAYNKCMTMFGRVWACLVNVWDASCQRGFPHENLEDAYESVRMRLRVFVCAWECLDASGSIWWDMGVSVCV